MRRYIVAALALAFVLSAFGQRGNTFYVQEFKGATVGQRITQAQASCNLSLPCVIVFDPPLSGLPVGDIPPKCSSCVWYDFTGKFGGLFGGPVTGDGGGGSSSPFTIPWVNVTGITGSRTAGTFLRGDSTFEPISWLDISGKPSLSYTNPYQRSAAGALTAGQVLLDYVASTYALVPAGCSDSTGASQFKMGTAPTGALTFSIKKNGTEFGTIAVASGQKTGTFSCPAQVVEVPTITDNFDSAQIGANWQDAFTTVVGQKSYAVWSATGTKLHAGSQAGYTRTYGLLWRTDSPVNGYCKVKSSQVNSGCVVNGHINSDGTFTGYAVYNASTNSGVYRCVNGVTPQSTGCALIGGSSGVGIGTNVEQELIVSGGTVQFKIAGVTKVSATDVSPITGGNVGVYTTTSPLDFDDFSAGTLTLGGAATIQSGDEITVVAPGTVSGADASVTLYTATQVSASDGSLGGGAGGGGGAVLSTQRLSLRSCAVARVSSADTACVGSATWGAAMPDANYAVFCSVGDPSNKTASKLGKWSFVWLSKSAEGFSYTLTNNDGGTDGQTVALDCMGVR